MQAASGTLTAAITAQERHPVQQVFVDWDNDGTFSQAIDDQTARVESITMDRTLTTDLPDTVNLLAGYSVATAVVVLSGNPRDETDDAPGYYSPYSTSSPIYGKRRRWRTAEINVGFVGTAGAELLTAFTGKTRSLASNGVNRTATLEILDNAETMRGHVDIPLVVADDHAGSTSPTYPSNRPNLNGSWVVDYVARQCGYYAAPPLRSNVVWAASFAGSAYPEVGSVLNISDNLSAPVSFVDGQFIQGVHGNQGTGSGTLLDYATSGTVSTNNGGEVLAEGWVWYQTSAGSRQAFCEVTSASKTLGANKITLLSSSADTLLVAVRRTNGGAITVWNSGLGFNASAWNYVGVHVYFTSTSIVIHARTRSSSATTTLASSSVTGQPTLDAVTIGQGEDDSGLYVDGSFQNYEAWQVSQSATTTSAPSWNDAYIGNSTIQPSLNTLTAVVPSDGAAIDVIQQIAAAELATAGFDEAGRFTFYTRDRWTSPPYTTSQRTIDASSLKDLTVTEAVDQVRNRIRATSSPAAVQNAGYIWRAAEVIRVRASSSVNVVAKLDQAATNVDTSVTQSTTNNPNSSFYRANTKPDGAGSTVTVGVTATVIDGTSVHLVITNGLGTDVYLVNPTGFTDAQGTPALALWGQSVLYAQSPVPDSTTVGDTAPTQTVSDVSDATSITQHGEQLLEIPVNPWLQNGDSLGTLVADLLARLKDPAPVVTGLSIPYDPRLQLGDRVTVVADQFGLSADFFLTGIHVTQAATAGANQTLDTRAV